MKVYLAGYNVDTNVLNELQKDSGPRMNVTPEVLSAAYARISRDPRPINEIRESAKDEVERSRKSNKTIIFKMGHHSVAEHAVFNLDIIGASRLAMEEIEKFRLCSYTEKSQRYITLDKDFVVPQEIKGTPFEDQFIEMIQVQNKGYHELFQKLKVHVFEKNADLASDPKNHNLLEGWAKEDARYITSLATESQVGLTINARNLELMLRRFASNPSNEIQTLGRSIYEQIAEVAPSIVLFHQANDRDLKTYPQLKELAQNIIDKNALSNTAQLNEKVQLIEYTKDADDIVAASLMHSATSLPYEQCKSITTDLSQKNKKEIFKTALKNMQLYDSILREFEYVNLTFNISLSSACFGQLKRHRMSTITSQSYDPNLEITIPESIKEIQMESYFQEIVAKTNDLYNSLQKEIPSAAPYILTNAHHKRVLIRTNVRELYHISRLREDAHAQWDIQNISKEMTRLAKQVAPLCCSLIGGKDRFNEIYQDTFGQAPKVMEAVLPGARDIK